MNQHRGSDFNQFLAQENLMTPTPRTDAIAHRGLGSVAYIAEMTDFARQLERENQTFRAAQKACEDCDAPRVDRIAELERELAAKDSHADEIYKAAVNLAAKLEADLATERALADRLADHLDTALHAFDNQEAPHVVRANRALAAWREARK